MPSPIVICEFCDQPFRKNVYGIHVKSKHVKELARQFLNDSEKPRFNTIKSISKGYNAHNIPVYSEKNDDGSCFFFGLKPIYFTQDDDRTHYIANEANMKAHLEFLRQVINAIPLTDFLSKVQPYREPPGVRLTSPNLVRIEYETLLTRK